MIPLILILAIFPLAWGIVLWSQLSAVYARKYGTPVTAHVYAKRITHQKFGGDGYSLLFHYDDGGPADSEEEVTQTEFSATPLDADVPAKGATLFGIRCASLDLAKLKAHLGNWLFLDCAGIAFIILGVVVFRRGPLREKRLIQSGSILAGIVIQRFEVPGAKAMRYKVQYRFISQGGEEVVRDRFTSQSAYLTADPGTTIRIFYDPLRPIQDHVPYELGLYEIVPSGE